MALNVAELTTWRNDVASRRDAAAALVVAESARNPGGSMHEQFLRAGNLGHLRSRVIELSAQHDWLAQAVTAVAAGGSHPAQVTGATTSGGSMSIPITPPRSGSR
ncbi:MAG TPA: hypothetical protein PLL72_10505 [Burkholderiaceae bacterium]|nr:hypothetical protein [Burkholderiaceae bacterium]